MTKKERQDVYALLGLIVLGSSVVMTVIVVQNDWSALRWQAVSAIAASVQAIAVTVAVFVAVGQIRASRLIADRARRQHLGDRLDELVFDTMDASVGAARSSISTVCRTTEFWLELGEASKSSEETDKSRQAFAAIMEGQVERFGPEREAVHESGRNLDAVARRLEQHLAVMGEETFGRDIVMLCMFSRVRMRAYYIEDMTIGEIEALKARSERLGKGWVDIRERVERLLRSLSEPSGNS